MKSDNIKKFMEELVDQLGYKLVSKEKDPEEEYTPTDADKYKDMNSKMLIGEIRLIEQDMAKVEAMREKMKSQIINFMQKQQSNDTTKRVFEGTRFLAHRLHLRDEGLNELAKLKSFLEKKLKEKSEAELREKFVNYYPDVEGQVDSISIEPTPTGFALVVVSNIALENKTTEKELEMQD
jgi:hypothetical protein